MFSFLECSLKNKIRQYDFYGLIFNEVKYIYKRIWQKDVPKVAALHHDLI